MIDSSEYDVCASAVAAVWKANEENLKDCIKQSMDAFPQPPIMANLEILSNHQFSKLLADVQRRSFYLGAIAMIAAFDEAEKAVKQ